MYRTTPRCAVLIGLAFLILTPEHMAQAASLREEAVNYRVQGYEAQRRGDLAAALSLYQKAAQLDPTYPTPQNDAGVMLEESGRMEEAEQAYQRALTLSPGYLEAHANLAMLYERMGQKEKAVYHWMKRYQLGDAADPWTAKAEERLVALGARSRVSGKGLSASRQQLVDEEFRAHAQSLDEFHAVTDKHGDWS